MTPTLPVPEIAELIAALVRRAEDGCEGPYDETCIEHGSPFGPSRWCDPCKAEGAAKALTSETQARQEAETDAIGSRDELNILKVKHAADVLARQQAERERAHERERWSVTYGELPETVRGLIEPHVWDNKNISEQRDWAVQQLTLSEQARAQAEQALLTAVAPTTLIAAAHMLRACADQIERLAIGYGSEQMRAIAARLDDGAGVVRLSLGLIVHQATTTDETP